MKHLWLALVLVYTGLCPPTAAGILTTNADDRELWTDDGYAVIVAVVGEVYKLGPPLPGYNTTLEPLVTLAGTFDPSKTRVIEVEFTAGRPTTSIQDVPNRGDFVAAVIRYPTTSNLADSTVIVSDYCTFMPGSSALVVVKGLDDPRIPQIVARIQEGRARAEREAKSGAATSPATQPAEEGG